MTTMVNVRPATSESKDTDSIGATSKVTSRKRRRLAPGITAKQLPWLDGKLSSFSSTASDKRKNPLDAKPAIPPRAARIEEVSSKFKNSPQGSFLKARSGLRAVGSTPALHRGSVNSPFRRRGSSMEPRVPSPHSNYKLSRSSPHLDGQETSSLKGSPPASSSYSPEDKSSDRIVDMVEDVPPRRGSLAHVSAHLKDLESPSPEMPGKYKHSVHFIPMPPPMVHSDQGSLMGPARRHNLEHAETNLDTAIERLEDLVQEAALVAEDSADQGQLEEMREIIEGATDTLQRTSSIPAKHLMATGSPLRVSSSSESSVSSSDASSESSRSSQDLETRPNLRHQLRHPQQRNEGSFPIHTNPYHAYKRADSWPTAPPHPSESVVLDWPNKNSNRSQSRRTNLSLDSTDSLTSPREVGVRPMSDKVNVPPPLQTPLHDHVHLRADSPRGRPRVRGARLHKRRVRSDAGAPPRRLRVKSPGYDSPLEDEEDLLPRDPKEFHKSEYLSSELRLRDQVHYHTFGIARHHRQQPIARNWKTGKKRITATIACINTALLGIIVGIYAGEVPRIQYILADEKHHVIVGNVVLYFGMAISTFLTWPLPLLHGRKPYILGALALALPLQFPQAIVVSSPRSPLKSGYKVGLLLSRAASGLVLGFANVNFITVLLDLFGASLQSRNPHQELVVHYDVRRHGGGMGLWLGIWSWCSIGSLAIGFQIGAGIIESKTPDWGFYIVVILLMVALLLNISAPETRRSAYRRSVTEVYDRDENFIMRRVARGEIKLHMKTKGPRYWFEEVGAGIKLSIMMMCQAGFAVLAVYLAWIYAQIVLVIVLLGALLSRNYKWHSRFVGLGVMSIAVGALLATPLTKAGFFSRERKAAFRTDSMTFEKQVTWTSHLVRRCIFTLALPLMGLAYTLSSAGRPVHWIIPIVFAGAVGFLSVLAIAECIGLIMETFDTCDLQPGVNTKHRLQSMVIEDKRRRTNYSSFPRVSAGIFASQTLAFMGAAVATEVGGILTRRIGAQASTGVTAGILLFLTILLILVLWRFKDVQVIPNYAFGTRRDTKAWEDFRRLEKEKDGWRPVVIGNPSGKFRRMSILELGGLSRWTEIRKLNFLIKEEVKEKPKRAYV
ncbi:hypothetical protein GQ43DRAFT_242571 [Delitschia confertaspora ATCC 74209]|uniref:MFS general substrate transporter n=1 Tax=Delitschia confertaspora ATCC 74209 TaxID=1513339 RepID=A0A9P4JCC8_9PLEO|nr:hypothetical protein GQ43DRAFT_242571 [Delitschia confertaspora ATCC 74209]